VIGQQKADEIHVELVTDHSRLPAQSLPGIHPLAVFPPIQSKTRTVTLGRETGSVPISYGPKCPVDKPADQ
jgi:hypothetical protein